MLLLVLCSFINWKYRSYVKRKGMNLAANAYGLLTSIVIIAFGMLCVVTINNYFSPGQEVFSNGDHHVVQIEGLQITNPKGFVLAANSPDALFDNDATTGSATVESVDDSTVTIKLSPDFQRVIYKEKYSRDIALQELEMQNSLPEIGKDGRLLIATNTNGKKDTLEFSTRFDDIYHAPKWKFWADDIDTMRYFVNGHESETHSYLRRGLPMSQVIAGLKADSMKIDLENLHIIRPHAYINGTSQEELKSEKYTDEKFAFELHGSSSSKIEAISTDGKAWRSVKKGQNKNYKGETIRLKKGSYYSIGYGGDKSTSFKLAGNGDTLDIIFRMPFMRYLSPGPDRPDNLVLLTQSLNLKPNDVDKSFGMLPDNIMLFDFFYHPDNRNRIYPKQLAYTTGPTTEILSVGVYDFHRPMTVEHENLSNGMSLSQTQAMGNKNVNWKVSIQDLKANNALYQPTAIKWTIVALTLILAIIMLYGNVRLDKIRNSYKRPMFSTVEFVAYMITIYLVTLRWFMLWRTAVFPPVEYVSPYDFYGMFQKAQNQRYFIAILVAFVFLVATAKAISIFGLWKDIKKIWDILIKAPQKLCDKIIDSIERLGQKNKWAKTIANIAAVICILILYSGIQIAPSFIKMTWIGILCPVMVYFVTTIIIHSIGSRSYDEPIGSNDKEVLATLRKKRLVFIADIANAIITAGVLAKVDSGYGILFLSFSVFWLLWELYDFIHVPDVTLSNGQTIKTWSKWTAALIPFMLLSYVLLIAKYKEIFKYLADGGIGHYLTAALFGATIGLCIFLVLYGAQIRKSWKKAIGWVLLPFILFGSAASGFDYYLDNKAQHTVERIRVHFATPDEALIEIQDNDTQRRYIQAAINHAIIGEYNDRGSEVNLIGENGTGYFKMQPHSPVGAMWGAQLSDISPVRFLIAEHSKVLGVVIVLLFMLMLAAGARQVKHHRFARCTLVQVPLLLLVQSLLIWMANTQRFIFLGQDLPMISINSSLAIAFYFSLMILWLTVMFYEKSTESQLSRYVDSKTRSYDRLDADSRLEFFMITSVFLLCIALAIFATSKVKTDGFMPVQAMEEVDRIINGDTDNGDYTSRASSQSEDADETEDVTTVTDFTLNGLFYRFQKENRKNYFPAGKDTWRDKDGRRHEEPMPIDMATVSKIISDFNESRADSIAMLFGYSENSSRPRNALAYNMWNNFVNKGVMHNNRNNVMHVRLKANGYLSIEIFNRFYNQKLPDPHATRWKGSIVASGSAGEAQVGKTRRNGVTMYVLPGSWMRNGRATALATGKAQIEGEGMIFLLDDTLNVAAQAPAGYAVAGFDNKIPDTDYLARNVRVNGAQTFVYPLAAQFYWARDIAQEAANRKAMQKRLNGDEVLPPNFDHDIALTISPTLTETIYKKFASHKDKTHRAVIVANGDGKIMAMVDHKREYELNPNDHRRINALSDSLYMVGRLGGSTARNYFGNVNLMALRYGPGSTQKPLTWTAVASGIDFPWRNLKIAPYNGIESKGGRYYIIRQFNGHPFRARHPMQTLCSDEKYGAEVSLNGFMTSSSNVYNALMAYIGSWPKDHFDKQFLSISNNVDGNHLFAKYNRGNFTDAFPILKSDKGNIRLNAHPIGKGESWLDNSLMQENFNTLFNFGRNLEEVGSHSFFEGNNDLNIDRPYYIAKENGRESRRRIMPSYSFVEPSALLSEVRSEKSDSINSLDFMELAIRSTAIGAQKVWNATPYGMAQAFGRMASLNQDYNLTVLDSSLVMPSYKRFEDLSKGYLDARPTQFMGMNDIFKPETNGTAKSMRLKNGTITDKNNKTYYLYAKTGTIGPKNDPNHHRFAVIITDRKLFDKDGDKDLENMKFYVLYFTYTRPGFQEYADIIQEVVDSKEFDAYMNGNNNTKKD